MNPGGQPCRGLEEVLERYRTLTPYVTLSGPTSFAPVIYHACEIVQSRGNSYHILVIIADGVVTTGMHEEQTIQAIVAASSLPLSIVMVGVGDGPFDTMERFDDKVPNRKFDNFQFVNFSKVQRKYGKNPALCDAKFATAALQEVPIQYKLICKMNYLGRSLGAAGPNHHLPSVVPPHLSFLPLDPPDVDFQNMAGGGGGGGGGGGVHQQPQDRSRMYQASYSAGASNEAPGMARLHTKYPQC